MKRINFKIFKKDVNYKFPISKAFGNVHRLKSGNNWIRCQLAYRDLLEHLYHKDPIGNYRRMFDKEEVYKSRKDIIRQFRFYKTSSRAMIISRSLLENRKFHNLHPNFAKKVKEYLHTYEHYMGRLLIRLNRWKPTKFYHLQVANILRKALNRRKRIINSRRRLPVVFGMLKNKYKYLSSRILDILGNEKYRSIRWMRRVEASSRNTDFILDPAKKNSGKKIKYKLRKIVIRRNIAYKNKKTKKKIIFNEKPVIDTTPIIVSTKKLNNNYIACYYNVTIVKNDNLKKLNNLEFNIRRKYFTRYGFRFNKFNNTFLLNKNNITLNRKYNKQFRKIIRPDYIKTNKKGYNLKFMWRVLKSKNKIKKLKDKKRLYKFFISMRKGIKKKLKERRKKIYKYNIFKFNLKKKSKVKKARIKLKKYKVRRKEKLRKSKKIQLRLLRKRLRLLKWPRQYRNYLIKSNRKRIFIVKKKFNKIKKRKKTLIKYIKNKPIRRYGWYFVDPNKYMLPILTKKSIRKFSFKNLSTWKYLKMYSGKINLNQFKVRRNYLKHLLADSNKIRDKKIRSIVTGVMRGPYKYIRRRIIRKVKKFLKRKIIVKKLGKKYFIRNIKNKLSKKKIIKKVKKSKLKVVYNRYKKHLILKKNINLAYKPRRFPKIWKLRYRARRYQRGYKISLRSFHELDITDELPYQLLDNNIVRGSTSLSIINFWDLLGAKLEKTTDLFNLAKTTKSMENILNSFDSIIPAFFTEIQDYAKENKSLFNTRSNFSVKTRLYKALRVRTAYRRDLRRNLFFIRYFRKFLYTQDAFNIMFITGLTRKSSLLADVIAKGLRANVKNFKQKRFLRIIKAFSYLYDFDLIRMEVWGKINKSRRTKRYLFKFGHFKRQTLGKEIDYSYRQAFTKYGTFGIKLWVA